MLIDMNKTNTKEKIRTVNISNRGQLVVPEDMRKDMGIEGGTTLVLIEKRGEIVIKKESEVLEEIEGEDMLWRRLSQEALKKAWDKEDEIWDDIPKGG